MPVTCPIPLRVLSQEEFGELSFEVMRDVFAIHNSLGRLLDESIYKQALTHLLGGEAHVLRMAEIRLDGVSVGMQLFRQVSDGVAFKLTAFEAEESLERFAAAARRMLACASLQALLWVNIARHRITFVTLQ